MGFWIFMFITNMLIPLMMIIFGKVFLKNPPKEINSIYGYRTSMSMKNRDTWDFAHQYCGKLWYRLGLAMLPISAAVMCFVLGKDENITGMAGGILCAVQTIVLIASIRPTEKALKKKFGNS
ncbi:MAG: SdpI family protein [Blautia sp.]|nr:SdpI family protein [Blautia sp.]